jgi:outer membrane biosynthesis protein TonB
VKTKEYVASEIALAVSLALHALAILTWQERAVLGRFGLFRPLARLFATPALMIPKPAATATPTITFIQQPESHRSEPRTFMETDETQVTGEEPKDAKYYSDRSTVAANPENPTGKEGDTPYLEGKETRVMSTETVAPGPAVPAIPAAPPAPPPPPPPPVVEQAKEQPAPKLADEGQKVVEENKLVMLDQPPPPPMTRLTPLAPTAAPAAPSPGSRREIAAIKSRMTASGVGRIGVAAFNVAGSPFGEYDKALIRAVQSRWYALIEQNGLYERAGTVTLHFNLMQDGSVQDMQVKENSAGEILALFCQKAVVDSAPFAPLPENLRLLIGNDPREVNFTFYY